MELIEPNADGSVENKTGEISVHQVSRGQYGSLGGSAEVARLLLGHGMNTNAQDEHHMISSHLHSDFGPAQMAQALLDYGANVNSGNNGEVCRTTLHRELEGEYH